MSEIDINKCKYFPKEQCTVELMDCVTCIYKQLQHLKEYLKISEIINIENDDLVFTSKILDKLIQENSNLQQKLEKKELNYGQQYKVFVTPEGVMVED